jgi:hydrogenase maturation protein HypF
MKKISLPFKVKRAMLACGADLKGAFAFARGSAAYMFDGFGDLADLDNYAKYEEAIKGASKKLSIKPDVVVCDLHPGYFSTQFAKNYTQYAVRRTLYEIQHHEAHIASVITDNAVTGDVLGVAFDGTGYGYDRNIWGGEFLLGGAKHFKRARHLDYIPMPGLEMAVKEPWRMAASCLYAVFGAPFLKLKIDFTRNIDKKKWGILKEMVDKRINSPMTSSMGRLFDAVGSMVLGRMTADFEAEVPIMLEETADAGNNNSYNFNNVGAIIKGVVNDLEKKVAPSAISAKFHNTIALMVLASAERYKARKVVLSGGVFQNKLLLDKSVELLKNAGFNVYAPSNISANDSGIPLGQIAIVNARL